MPGYCCIGLNYDKMQIIFILSPRREFSITYNILPFFCTAYFSLKSSPKTLKERAVIAISMPGEKTIQGAELINTLLALIIDPQVAVGGWAPSPRKLKPASVRTYPPSFSPVMTKERGMHCGNI